MPSKTTPFPWHYECCCGNAWTTLWSSMPDPEPARCDRCDRLTKPKETA